MSFFSTPRLRAFTLIELLVVIVVIGILATITTATYNGAIERARVARAQAFAVQAEQAFLAETIANADTSHFILKADFDEGVGTSFSDSSGNNHPINCSLANFDWTTNTPFSEGSAVSNFVGGGQCSVASSSLKHRARDEFAFSVWLYPATNGNHINDKLFNLPSSHGVEFNGSGNLYAWIRNNSGGIEYFSVNADFFKSDRWYHILVSFDGEEVTIYVDGDILLREAFPNENILNQSVLMMRTYGGAVDDFRYYDFGLSPEEIRQGEVSN